MNRYLTHALYRLSLFISYVCLYVPVHVWSVAHHLQPVCARGVFAVQVQVGLVSKKCSSCRKDSTAMYAKWFILAG